MHFKINGYKLLRRDRNRFGGGGQVNALFK